MTGESTCTACDAKRTFVSAVPVAADYEMRTFVCPKCKSVLHLVVARTTRSANRKES